MKKAKTHFPQVPVEIAKKVAKAESNGHVTEPLKRPRKSRNGNALPDHDGNEDEGA